MIKTAVVFPGQGSQRPGMAKDFYDSYPAAKKIFDKAAEATGEDIAAICFTEDPRLDLTEFTQPCILTAEIAMLQVLREEFSFAPTLFAGHSLGEYTALVAADVIPFEDAVQIVRKRGALMQEAVPQGKGAMAAIVKENINLELLQKIVTQAKAEIANYNSTEQVVISGEKSAVEKASENISQEILDVRVIPLNVSAPFHSSLMKTIEPEFLAYLQKFSSRFQMQNAEKVISNFSGAFHDPQNLLQNLVKQISGSVRWLQNMQELAGACEKIFEVGPNRVLTKFFATLEVNAEISEEKKNVPAIINIRSAKKNF